MTFDKLKEILNNPEVGTKFKVYGYIDSKGNKRDAVFEVTDLAGKRNMQEESLTKIRLGSVSRTSEDGGDDSIWNEAMKSVEKGIRKSLSGENSEWAKRSSARSTDSAAVYVYHLKEVETSNIVENKKVNSATKTLVKKSINDQLSISSYVFNIKLIPGKFDRVEIL